MSGRKVYKWSAIDRGLNSVMTFGGNIVLARLLDPSDFGLVAMVAIFIAVAQNLSSSGMSDGIIYKPQPTQRDYSTVFVFNAAFGLFFCLLFVAFSGFFAEFFKAPQIKYIMVAVGICFFFQTLTFAQETRMRKELDMKKLAMVRLSATATVTTIGIVMAATGWGYWALVVTHSGLSVALFIYYVLFSRWLPKIAFYRDSFKEMFGYGIHLMLGYVVNQIGRNINTTLIGKFNSPFASGIYSQAQKLQEVPYSLTEAVFNWPFFSVLANEQDAGNRVALASNMNKRLWCINLAIAFLLVLVSWPAFNLLYGAKWDAAIPIFRLLLVYGVASSMKYFYQVVFKAYGRPKLVRNLSFIEVALQLALLAVFYKDGVMMIAMTQVVAAVIILLVHIYYYKATIGVRLMRPVVEMLKAAGIPAISLVTTALMMTMWYDTAIPIVNCLCIGCVFAATAGMSYLIFRPSWLRV